MKSRQAALSAYGPWQKVAYVTSRECRQDSSPACPLKKVHPSHWAAAGFPSCHMRKQAISGRRPSNTSSSGTGPCSAVSGIAGSTSTMGNRRRAAAIASPSRVCAFSRTSSSSSITCHVARSATGGRAETLARPAVACPSSQVRAP